MTWDFLGGEVGSLLPIDATVYEQTTAGYFDPDFARAAIRTPSGWQYAESPTLPSRTDVWFHAECLFQSVSGSVLGTIFQWFDSGGTPRIRVNFHSGTSALSMDWWNGSAWVVAGTFTLSLIGVKQIFDIHAVVNSSSGLVDLYIAGTQRIASGSIDLSGAANLNKFQLWGTSTSVSRITSWSQVGVRTISTIGAKIITVPMTGNGAETAWAGDYTNIDETVYSDGDLISGAVNGDKELYTGTPVLSSLTGYVVTAVAVTSRAKQSGAGPAQFRHLLRSGGVIYNSSTHALDFGYGAFCDIWETNPNTGVAWLSTEISALQYGVEAIT